MMAWTCKFALAGFFLVTAAGCEMLSGPIELPRGQVEARVDYSDLEAVLAKAVTKDGLLIVSALKKQSAQLDKQLMRMAVAGPKATPKLFPDAEDRLAYWYNARTAWAMKLALASKRPQKMGRRELTSRSFPLDGRKMSLGDIDGLLERYDDWRVLVSSPGVTLSRARLPAKPFSSHDICHRIATRFSQFVDEDTRFVIDIEHERIIMPRVLWQFRDKIIESHRRDTGAEGANLTTALLRYVEGSAHRRLQDAIGYKSVAAGRSLLPLALVSDDWRIGL